jgi:hypothetical protein
MRILVAYVGATLALRMRIDAVCIKSILERELRLELAIPIYAIGVRIILIGPILQLLSSYHPKDC